MTVSICESWITRDVKGCGISFCSIETKDKTFDALKDCTKRNCPLHNPQPFDTLWKYK